jgi:NAD-dependent SIR2 family protein deacetylase
MAHLGLRFEEVSTPKWWFEDPCFAWGFMGHRYKLYLQAQPHEGYHIMKRIADQITSNSNGDYFVFTSNVDGHFIRAGYDENKITECHGSLQYLQYAKPDHNRSGEQIFPAAEHLKDLEVDPTTFRVPDEQMLPRIDGHLLRPNVLQFFDSYWASDRCDKQEDNQGKFTDQLEAYNNEYDASDFLVVIESGAGTAVPTVRYFSEDLVQSYGGTLIRLNPRDPEGPVRADSGAEHTFIGLPLGSKDALQQIEQELKNLNFF